MRIKNKLLAAGCIAVSAAALLTGLSCNDHEMAPFSKSLAAGAKQSVSSGSTRQVDILFVIDNSYSMAEEQASLDANFNKFLDQLITANADYRLGVVSTTYNKGLKGDQLLSTDAYQVQNNDFQSSLQLTDTQFNDIKSKCGSFFSSNASDSSDVKGPWISSESETLKKLANDKDALKKELLDYFRCQFKLGTKGNGIEQGLINVTSAVVNSHFKRDGSLLAIVFVTDENDCSNVRKQGDTVGQEFSNDSWDAGLTHNCETMRNIEDSCSLTGGDYIDDSELSSRLATSDGQLVSIKLNGATEDIPSKTLRQWCVQGDKQARDVLTKCYNAYKKSIEGDSNSSCGMGRYINCPDGGCIDGKLTHRSDFYDDIINAVKESNAGFYRSENPNYDELSEAEQIKLAKQDVIVASILNRDRGIRYDSKLPENWCGEFGTQGYRYQLFAEMFENDPIYAPICCMGDETFMTSITSASSSTPEQQTVCASGTDIAGKNSDFGPVLGAIGRRIGEAVNTLCTNAPPITCDAKACPKDGPASASCPCNHGCNLDEPHMVGTPNEYYLCNEFQLKIGTVKHIASDDPTDEEIAKPYADYQGFSENEFKADYDSTYCMSRTGSPIQINLNRNDPGRDLVIEYPKKVSSTK